MSATSKTDSVEEQNQDNNKMGDENDEKVEENGNKNDNHQSNEQDPSEASSESYKSNEQQKQKQQDQISNQNVEDKNSDVSLLVGLSSGNGFEPEQATSEPAEQAAASNHVEQNASNPVVRKRGRPPRTASGNGDTVEAMEDGQGQKRRRSLRAEIAAMPDPAMVPFSREALDKEFLSTRRMCDPPAPHLLRSLDNAFLMSMQEMRARGEPARRPTITVRELSVPQRVMDEMFGMYSLNHASLSRDLSASTPSSSSSPFAKTFPKHMGRAATHVSIAHFIHHNKNARTSREAQSTYVRPPIPQVAQTPAPPVQQAYVGVPYPYAIPQQLPHYQYHYPVQQYPHVYPQYQQGQPMYGATAPVLQAYAPVSSVTGVPKDAVRRAAS